MTKQPETSVDDARSDVTSDSPDPSSSTEREAARPSGETPPLERERPKEYGGRKGPDPVRYGDWEKNGRCIDF